MSSPVIRIDNGTILQYYRPHPHPHPHPRPDTDKGSLVNIRKWLKENEVLP